MRVHAPPLHHSFLLRLQILFLLILHVFLFMVPTKLHCNKSSVSTTLIASMILGALTVMAQMKVKRPLAHSSIGNVGYIRTGFSCGTIEGIQSLLIGIFIYALMTIDAFAIVLALWQTRIKYIADLGALAKTNPISAISFSITMFSYIGIPPLAGFCSKFYLFFTALCCGACFLAPMGVMTSGTLSFYVINMDVVCLFVNSSFLFFTISNLYFINLLYQFE